MFQNGVPPTHGLYHTQLDIQRGSIWPLAQGFGPSSQLVLSGNINHGADRFNFDLVSSKGVAFHFNPRFNEGQVVRNSKTNGCWDKEERSGALTLAAGQYFSIAIFCQESGYQVLVNGTVFTHFQHRHSPLTVTHLQVAGDVKLKGAFYCSRNVQPNPTTPRLPPGMSQSLDVRHGDNWCLPQGFRPGTQLVLHGFVNPNADRFHLDLVSRNGVAFHFNPRFNQGEIVRNSHMNGFWGSEERDGGLILAQGQSFSIEFFCQNDGIQVAINGRFFTVYKHRHDPKSIIHLKIEGDAKLHQALYRPSSA